MLNKEARTARARARKRKEAHNNGTIMALFNDWPTLVPAS